MATKAAAQSARNRRKIRRRIWGISFLVILTVVFVGFVFATVYWTNLLKSTAVLIPKLRPVMQEVASQPTEIVSADGEVLFRIQAQFRNHTPYEDIPKLVIDATLAAEDKRFFDHSGVDIWALGRSVVESARAREFAQGGSTLTMQLAKRVFTSPKKTLDRKIQDMALAYQMEKTLTKEQILELYLNQVFYGHQAYGIGAAASVYFGKKLDKLTISEAATLARLVRRPSDENPFDDLEKALRNRDVVLGIMRAEGMISAAEYDKAIKEKLVLRKKSRYRMVSEKLAPFFVDYVLAQVKQTWPDVDVSKGGYRIETTLNMKMQREAESQMTSALRRYRGLRVRTGAFVALDRDGGVVAMVGGPDYETSEFNQAVLAKRQPGSSFKPFVYAVGFQNSVYSSPYSTVNNGRVRDYRDINGRDIEVAGGGSYGGVSILSALTYSYNRAAVNAISDVGPSNVVRAARDDFGIQNKLPAVKSLALGSGEVSPLEMAQAYSVFQLKGRRAQAHGITRLLGPDGVPLPGLDTAPVQSGMSPATADKIDLCLKAVVTSGTGRDASRVVNARGKTGTTNDNKDAWFCGYTDQLIGVVWFANPVKTKRGETWMRMSDAAMGGKISAPTWGRIMQSLQEIQGEKYVEAQYLNVRRREDRNEDNDQPEVSPEPEVGGDPVVPVTAGSEPDSPRRSPVVIDPDNPPVRNNDPANDPASGGAVTNPPRSNPPRTDPPETVSVDVCADSGQRANGYCPERVTRKFRPGSEPRGRCPIHG